MSVPVNRPYECDLCGRHVKAGEFYGATINSSEAHICARCWDAIRRIPERRHMERSDHELLANQ